MLKTKFNLTKIEKHLLKSRRKITLKQFAEEFNLNHRKVLKEFKRFLLLLNEDEKKTIKYIKINSNSKEITFSVNYKALIWFVVNFYPHLRKQVENYLYVKK